MYSRLEIFLDGHTKPVFGLREIGRREVGAREIEEKSPTSSVWFKERLEREMQDMWDPRVFLFFSLLRRNSRETVNFFDLTFLPLTSLWVALSQSYNLQTNWK
jgi:hypothetical protein